MCSCGRKRLESFVKQVYHIVLRSTKCRWCKHEKRIMRRYIKLTDLLISDDLSKWVLIQEVSAPTYISPTSATMYDSHIYPSTVSMLSLQWDFFGVKGSYILLKHMCLAIPGNWIKTAVENIDLWNRILLLCVLRFMHYISEQIN